MPVVSFISEKGGVGKTTSCYHVGVALARYHDKRVLIIDADYQRGGITGRFFPRLIEGAPDSEIETLFQKFQQLYSAADPSTGVTIYEWEGIDAKIHLIPFDKRLSTVSASKLPSTNNIKENNHLLYRHLEVISKTIEPLKERYDYILIDSHPEVSDVLRSVIFASDYCVSPVKLDKQSSVGVATIIGEISDVNADVAMLSTQIDCSDYSPTIFAGSIGMMAREWAKDLKWTEQSEYALLRRTGGVFDNYVTEGDGLRQAAANRRPVYDINLQNADKQSQQFKQITEELIKKCP